MTIERAAQLHDSLVFSKKSADMFAGGIERLAAIFQYAGAELQNLIGDFTLSRDLDSSTYAIAELMMAWREVGEVGVMFSSKMLAVAFSVREIAQKLENGRSQYIKEAQQLQQIINGDLQPTQAPAKKKGWLGWLGRPQDTGTDADTKNMGKQKPSETLAACMEIVVTHMQDLHRKSQEELVEAVAQARKHACPVGSKMVHLRSGWRGGGNSNTSPHFVTTAAVPLDICSDMVESKGSSGQPEPVNEGPLTTPSITSKADDHERLFGRDVDDDAFLTNLHVNKPNASHQTTKSKQDDHQSLSGSNLTHSVSSKVMESERTNVEIHKDDGVSRAMDPKENKDVDDRGYLCESSMQEKGWQGAGNASKSMVAGTGSVLASDLEDSSFAIETRFVQGESNQTERGSDDYLQRRANQTTSSKVDEHGGIFASSEEDHFPRLATSTAVSTPNAASDSKRDAHKSLFGSDDEEASPVLVQTSNHPLDETEGLFGSDIHESSSNPVFSSACRAATKTDNFKARDHESLFGPDSEDIVVVTHSGERTSSVTQNDTVDEHQGLSASAMADAAFAPEADDLKTDSNHLDIDMGVDLVPAVFNQTDTGKVDDHETLLWPESHHSRSKLVTSNSSKTSTITEHGDVEEGGNLFRPDEEDALPVQVTETVVEASGQMQSSEMEDHQGCIVTSTVDAASTLETNHVQIDVDPNQRDTGKAGDYGNLLASSASPRTNDSEGTEHDAARRKLFGSEVEGASSDVRTTYCTTLFGSQNEGASGDPNQKSKKMISRLWDDEPSDLSCENDAMTALAEAKAMNLPSSWEKLLGNECNDELPATLSQKASSLFGDSPVETLRTNKKQMCDLFAEDEVWPPTNQHLATHVPPASEELLEGSHHPSTVVERGRHEGCDGMEEAPLASDASKPESKRKDVENTQLPGCLEQACDTQSCEMSNVKIELDPNCEQLTNKDINTSVLPDQANSTPQADLDDLQTTGPCVLLECNPEETVKQLGDGSQLDVQKDDQGEASALSHQPFHKPVVRESCVNENTCLHDGDGQVHSDLQDDSPTDMQTMAVVQADEKSENCCRLSSEGDRAALDASWTATAEHEPGQTCTPLEHNVPGSPASGGSGIDIDDETW